MHAPLTVLPAPFPRGSFEKAKAAMELFNTLIDRVSRADDYLQSTLRPAAEYDDFTVSLSFNPAISRSANKHQDGTKQVLKLNRS